jgi:hypothetical protein
VASSADVLVEMDSNTSQAVGNSLGEVLDAQAVSQSPHAVSKQSTISRVSSKRHQATASIEANSTTESATCKPTLKFIPAKGPLSNESHKTSLVWEYFAHFDPIACPNKDKYRICMVC